MDQKRLDDEAFVTSTSNQCRFFLLDAHGGSGKTFTLNVLLHQLRAKGNKWVASATRGVAASLLHGGRTFHTISKCQLKVDDTTVPKINYQSNLAILREVKVFVGDEAPMTNIFQLESMDRTLQDIMGVKHFFEAKQ